MTIAERREKVIRPIMEATPGSFIRNATLVGGLLVLAVGPTYQVSKIQTTLEIGLADIKKQVGEMSGKVDTLQRVSADSTKDLEYIQKEQARITQEIAALRTKQGQHIKYLARYQTLEPALIQRLRMEPFE
jgi:hypothetical protein